MHKMLGYVLEYNETMLAIMDRTGAKREGILRHDKYRQGRFCDTHVYGITRDEFRARMEALRTGPYARHLMP